MKIALPSRQDRIDDHFGHCEYFTIVTLDNDNKTVLSQETIASPAGCGCKSNIAQILADMGVTVMLAGNMGEGAVHVLKNCGIDVVRGCSGKVTDVVQNWADGTLIDSGDFCHEHEHGCQH